MLKDWLGIDPNRRSVYMHASMLRAAPGTLVHFNQMPDNLCEDAFEHMPRAHGCSSVIPPGCDSDAFCIQLRNAYAFSSNMLVCDSSHKFKQSVKEWKAGKG